MIRIIFLTYRKNYMPRKAVVIPPYLKKGDLVGIVCPAGFMPVDKVSECVRVLYEVWGLRA